jgi:hypothetical protein
MKNPESNFQNLPEFVTVQTLSFGSANLFSLWSSSFPRLLSIDGDMAEYFVIMTPPLDDMQYFHTGMAKQERITYSTMIL